MTNSEINALVQQVSYLANRDGLLGQRTRYGWMPPQSGTQDPMGQFVKMVLPPQSGSEAL